MTTNQTADTEAAARRYFRAWTSGDTSTVASLLAPDFRFLAGDMSIDGRDAFMSASAFPRDATTRMIAEAYQDGIGFQMYDAVRGPLSVRIVEQLTIRDGLIQSSAFVADLAAFMALVRP